MARQQRQNKFQARLQELRETGLPEKVYIGQKTDFDGVACDVFRTHAPSLDELVALANPTTTNNGHGGVFKFSGARYEADPERFYSYAKTILGVKEMKSVTMKELADPTNVEVHLLQDPDSGYVHAFFMPSQRYVTRLRNEMQGDQEDIS